MRTLATAATLVASLALASACGYSSTPVPSARPVDTATSAAPSAPATPAPPACDNTAADVTASYAPDRPLPTPGQMPSGSTMRKIQDRGYLIAGIAADSYLLSSRNPFTGNLEGFDDDMVNGVAKAIFGDSYEDHLQLRVITPADRIPLLESDDVDIVVRNMTINCSRWEQIAFSAEYYRSGQKVLVGRDAGITSLADLSGKRVCAPTGTTSIDNIRQLAPDAIPVTAANDTFCMVKFQNGEADALSTDDTVLAGLAAQDPYAVVLDGEPLTAEPYGIGVNAQHVDLVRFINAMLEQMRADGTWEASYQRWLQPTLGKGTGQPQPLYGR